MLLIFFQKFDYPRVEQLLPENKPRFSKRIWLTCSGIKVAEGEIWITLSAGHVRRAVSDADHARAGVSHFVTEISDSVSFDLTYHPAPDFCLNNTLKIGNAPGISVIGLGSFWKILGTNLLTKVAQTFPRLWGYFEKCQF